MRTLGPYDRKTDAQQAGPQHARVPPAELRRREPLAVAIGKRFDDLLARCRDARQLDELVTEREPRARRERRPLVPGDRHVLADRARPDRMALGLQLRDHFQRVQTQCPLRPAMNLRMRMAVAVEAELVCVRLAHRQLRHAARASRQLKDAAHSRVRGSRSASAIHSRIAGSANIACEYDSSGASSSTPYVRNRVTTGANIASAIENSPNRNGPPLLSRHSRLIVCTRAASASASGVWPCPRLSASTSIGISRRSAATPARPPAPPARARARSARPVGHNAVFCSVL